MGHFQLAQAFTTSSALVRVFALLIVFLSVFPPRLADGFQANPTKAAKSTGGAAHPNVAVEDRPSQATTDGDDVKKLSVELDALKAGQQQAMVARADQAVNFANNVIQWSAVLLTTFAIMLALAGFLGLREIQAIRKYSHEIDEIKSQFLSHLHSVESLEGRIAAQLRELSDTFAKESQTFIEASYNFNTATLAYSLGDNARAIEYYRRALQLQPQNAGVYFRMGRAYTNLDDTRAAIEAFQKALDLKPDNAEALRGMATAYRYIDLEKSIDFAQRATVASPADYESWDYLGLLYRDKTQIDAAIDSHQRARRIHSRPETDFFLSLLFVQKKDMERAKLMMQSANVSLGDAQAADRVRPLWAAVIRCGKAILEEKTDTTRTIANEISQLVTTERIAEAVASHFAFLLQALGRSSELKDFLEAAVPDRFRKTVDSQQPVTPAQSATDAARTEPGGRAQPPPDAG